MAVDTLFLCFLEDEKLHKDHPELLVMPKGLKKIITKHKESKKTEDSAEAMPLNDL